MQVSSTEFQQNVGQFQDAAQREPVVITKRNRPHTVLMSAAMYEILTKGRVVRRVEDLDEDTIKAIATATVPPDQAAPDRLLADWTP